MNKSPETPTEIPLPENSPLSPEKLAKWAAVAAEFQNTTDGLGLEIDPGIMDLVIVFNAMGFKTS